MIAIIAALFFQTSPEIHLKLTERAERLAQAINSQVDCERLGYTVNIDGVKKEGVLLLNSAVEARMRMESAQDMVVSAVRRDEAELDKRAATVNRRSDMPAYDSEWRARCESLAADSLYAEYYKAPAREN